jgi:peptidylprolyl isomerase
MTEDRRRQLRRQRQRQRREARPTPQQAASADVAMPGIFGWMQRNGRLLVLVGILVMVLSLGGSVLLGNVDDPEPQGSTATVAPSAEARPIGTPGADGVIRQYSGPPPMQIDPTRDYEAVFRTEKGDFKIELEPEAAPGYVNNFVFLARNRFYDGLTFHRVIPGFVAQGGDPTGTGSGGPGYTVREEKNNRELGVGAIAMARSSAGVSGSQFFITLEPQPALEPQFAAFGLVTEGMDVVRALTARDPSARAQPPGDRILKIEIVEKGS